LGVRAHPDLPAFIGEAQVGDVEGGQFPESRKIGTGPHACVADPAPQIFDYLAESLTHLRACL
jgi:hypothetical protein